MSSSGNDDLNDSKGKIGENLKDSFKKMTGEQKKRLPLFTDDVAMVNDMQPSKKKRALRQFQDEPVFKEPPVPTNTIQVESTEDEEVEVEDDKINSYSNLFEQVYDEPEKATMVEMTTETNIEEIHMSNDEQTDHKIDKTVDIMQEPLVRDGLGSTLQFLKCRGIVFKIRNQTERKESFYEYKTRQSYAPDPKIEYYDDSGQILDTKAAYKHLSHRFHGRAPGKRKQDKQMARSFLQRNHTRNFESSAAPAPIENAGQSKPTGEKSFATRPKLFGMQFKRPEL